MRGRFIPAGDGSRRLAITSPSTARRRSTAWPSCLQASVRRGHTAAARRSRGRSRPVHRGGRLHPRPAHCASRRSTCPMATRWIPRNMRINPNGWSGFLTITRAAEAGGAADPGRRLQRHPDAGVTSTIPPLWVNDALFLPETRARFRALTNLGLTDARSRVTDESKGSTRFGIIRPGPGRKTTASASTTCCCRRAPAASSRRRHRQACPGLGAAVRPRSGLDRARSG